MTIPEQLIQLADELSTLNVQESTWISTSQSVEEALSHIDDKWDKILSLIPSFSYK